MQVFMDIPSFLIILVISMYAFGVCFYAISHRVTTSQDWIAYEMIGMYRMAYGDFAYVDDYGGVEWLFFLLSTVLMPLVMMNLLIAIISDTFERVYTSKTASDYKEKTALILEVENLMFWRRNVKSRVFLHVVKYRGEDETEVDEWEGRSAALKKEIERMLVDSQKAITKAVEGLKK